MKSKSAGRTADREAQSAFIVGPRGRSGSERPSIEVGLIAGLHLGRNFIHFRGEEQSRSSRLIAKGARQTEGLRRGLPELSHLGKVGSM